MKRILTFIPLGIGISAAIIYIFNVIQFRVINNSATLLQILTNLKIYLYISVAGFLTYFFIKLLSFLNNKNNKEKEFKEEVNEETNHNNNYESYTNNNMNNYSPYNMTYSNQNTYVPNYDYVPRYKKENETYQNSNVIEEKKDNYSYKADDDSVAYCFKCGFKIGKEDVYCRSCGARQKEKKPIVNSGLRNVINVLEIVILILILYFSVSIMFDYKESKDPNFKSPFKVSMTK